MLGSHLVLVVDDDPSIRLLCRVNLELDGHRVLEAASVEEARALAEAEPVDVAILDVHIGTGDGLALLGHLRSDHPGVGIALLSGTADIASVRAAQPDAVLGKPFTLDELREAVSELGGRHRAAGLDAPS